MKKIPYLLAQITHWQRWLFCSALLLCLAVSGAAGETATPSWQTKVDQGVLQSAAEGPTEFLVFLQDQADLSGADSLPGKKEKGAYVFATLTATASRSQGKVLTALQKITDQTGPVMEYRPYWIVNAIWVRGDAAAVEMLARRLDVAHIYANPKVRLDLPEQPASSAAPNIPQDVTWNLAKVRAPLVWAAGYTGQGVVVGGADTGYIWDHPALKSKYRGWNGTSVNHNYSWHDAIHSDTGSCGWDSPVPCDPYGHGTHTMGIMVGGDDGQGNQIGMAPGARWIGCRNMDHAGNGTPARYMECYQWFIAPTDLNGSNPNPAMAPDVINNSWGCPAWEGCTDPNVLKSAVEAVRAAGILTVQSAGNEGTSCSSVSRPAAIYEASFTVGNTDSNDIIAASSSRGPVTVDGSNRLKPNVSAPGQSIYSSFSPSGYKYLNGTSMAAPHVVGLAALLMSAKPEWKGHVDQIEETIETNAIPRTTDQVCGGIPGTQIPNNTYGFGRIDAWNSIVNLPRTLELTKTPSKTFFDPGQVVTYTLKVTYTYPLTPTYNVVISDAIPNDTSFITATLPHIYIDNIVSWKLPVMINHQTNIFELVVKISPSAGEIIANDNYTIKSDEFTLKYGVPILINRMHYYYFPWVQVFIP